LAELLAQKEAEASLVALVVAETESVLFRQAQRHQPAAAHPSQRRQLRRKYQPLLSVLVSVSMKGPLLYTLFSVPVKMNLSTTRSMTCQSCKYHNSIYIGEI
jgi:hypothetical protein